MGSGISGETDAGGAVPALAIERLSVCFDGQPVLRDVSLSLERGEKVAMAGPSGAGKSTVLRCVMGLVVPEAGEIRLFGKQLNGRTAWTLRRRVAYVAQEPDLGPGTAGDALRRPFGYRAQADKQDRLDRLPALMDRFGLAADLLAKDTASLSGGEKQRIALIAAILLDRPLVLLDEASSALDAENRRRVSAFFEAAQDVSVLSVSHDGEWGRFVQRTVTLSGPSGPGGG